MCARRWGWIVALLVTWASAQAQERPLLLHGGTIYTEASDDSRVEALVARQGRVVHAGTLADARARFPQSEEIDLQGAVAYPGFIDAHAHLSGVGFAQVRFDLTGTASLQELKDRLRAWSEANPTGAITGRGWIETRWPEGRMPTRQDLEEVVADRPVFLVRADGHAAVANTKALAQAGIDGTTPDPAGGLIERDRDGEASGLLIDNAADLVERAFPAPNREQYKAALAAGARLYASRGWTGVGNMDTSWLEAEELATLAREGRLPIRVDGFLRASDAAHAFAKTSLPDSAGLVQIRGVKLYVDGALGSRGAALLAPYADAPETAGLLLTEPAELLALLRRAREAGIQVAVHAIGDRGNRLALAGMVEAFADRPEALRAARWRIEHAQVLAADDVGTFGETGVIASMQPSHAISDLYFAPSRLGPERLKGAYAWHDLLASGAVIAAGSDAPVEKGDPLIEFYAATYRHDLEGKAGADWHLEQAMTPSEAVAALTLAPAYAVAQEDERGSLKVGKRADISVFSADLFKSSPAEVLEARAVMTIVDGKVVFTEPANPIDN